MLRWWVLGILVSGFAGCGGRALTAARVYVEQGDWEAAEAQLEEVVLDDPGNAEAYYWLGHVYGRTGRWVEMASALSRAEELDPGRWGKRARRLREKYWVEVYNLGVDRAKKGDLEGAERAFRDAIAIDSTRVEAYKNLGFCLYKLGDVEGAIKTYEKASRVAPDDADVWDRLGFLWFQKGEYERAAECIRRGLAVDSTDARMWTHLASAYSRTGKTEEAITAYERASKFEPRDGDVWYNLGVLYTHQEEYERAARCYRKALEISPDDADALMNLTLLYVYRLERWDEALPLLLRIVEREPENREAWEMLSIVYVRKGMGEKAREAYTRAQGLKGK